MSRTTTSTIRHFRAMTGLLLGGLCLCPAIAALPIPAIFVASVTGFLTIPASAAALRPNNRAWTQTTRYSISSLAIALCTLAVWAQSTTIHGGFGIGALSALGWTTAVALLYAVGRHSTIEDSPAAPTRVDLRHQHHHTAVR